METSTFSNLGLRARDGSGSRRPRMPIHSRVEARLDSFRLDMELAAERPVELTGALAARADQLTAPRSRRRLVAALREVADELRSPVRRHAAAAPLARSTAAPWAEAMLAVADRLEHDGINPCALARLNLLLTDGNGPLYNPAAEPPIGVALWSIADVSGLPAWTS